MIQLVQMSLAGYSNRERTHVPSLLYTPGMCVVRTLLCDSLWCQRRVSPTQNVVSTYVSLSLSCPLSSGRQWQTVILPGFPSRCILLLSCESSHLSTLEGTTPLGGSYLFVLATSASLLVLVMKKNEQQVDVFTF